MGNKKRIVDVFGDIDVLVGYRLKNKIGMGTYKDFNGITVSKNIIQFEFDPSLKDLCDEFGIYHYD